MHTYTNQASLLHIKIKRIVRLVFFCSVWRPRQTIVMLFVEQSQGTLLEPTTPVSSPCVLIPISPVHYYQSKTRRWLGGYISCSVWRPRQTFFMLFESQGQGTLLVPTTIMCLRHAYLSQLVRYITIKAKHMAG